MKHRHWRWSTGTGDGAQALAMEHRRRDASTHKHSWAHFRPSTIHASVHGSVHLGIPHYGMQGVGRCNGHRWSNVRPARAPSRIHVL